MNGNRINVPPHPNVTPATPPSGRADATADPSPSPRSAATTACTADPNRSAAPEPSVTADDLDALGAGYTVLSRLLLEPPSQETLDRVRCSDLLAHWPLPADADTARGLELLARSGETGESVEDIRWDHNRLFVGPEKLLAPPYESVHRSLDGLVFEAETFQVRAFYARFGLHAPRLDREPDDHIGLELELLATLSSRALRALERQDSAAAATLIAAQREFLHEHVLLWAPDLMTMVECGADTAFHQGVGALGQGVLAHAGSVFA